MILILSLIISIIFLYLHKKNIQNALVFLGFLFLTILLIIFTREYCFLKEYKNIEQQWEQVYQNNKELIRNTNYDELLKNNFEEYKLNNFQKIRIENNKIYFINNNILYGGNVMNEISKENYRILQLKYKVEQEKLGIYKEF